MNERIKGRVLFSEKRNWMTFLSAYDDLVLRSLSHLRSEFERLYFLIKHRGKNGTFYHWGLENKHGPERTQFVMEQAYKDSILSLLRNHPDQCWKELAISNEDFSKLHKQACELRDDLAQHPDPPLTAPALQHFNLMLFLFERLSLYRTDDLNASPHPPLDPESPLPGDVS